MRSGNLTNVTIVSQKILADDAAWGGGARDADFDAG
ncbi:MAG: hypothetical protein RLZZ282_771, partial [Verrucomicrobiota bacterium]